MVLGGLFGGVKPKEELDDALSPSEKLKIMRKVRRKLVPPPRAEAQNLTTVTFGQAEDSDGIMMNGYCEIKGGFEGCQWEPISTKDEDELFAELQKAAGGNPAHLAEVEKTRTSSTKNRPHASIAF